MVLEHKREATGRPLSSCDEAKGLSKLLAGDGIQLPQTTLPGAQLTPKYELIKQVRGVLLAGFFTQ